MSFLKLFLFAYLSFGTNAQAANTGGLLMVTGKAGASQPDHAYVRKCEFVRPMINLTTCEPAQKLPLNTALALAEGDYLLTYGFSEYHEILNVKADQTIEIKLTSIPVAKSTVSIYRDGEDLTVRKLRGIQFMLNVYAGFLFGSCTPDFNGEVKTPILCQALTERDTLKIGELQGQNSQNLEVLRYEDANCLFGVDCNKATVALLPGKYVMWVKRAKAFFEIK